MEEGLTILFSRLCQLQLENEPTKFVVNPIPNEAKLRRLRAKLYDTVFRYLKGPHRSDNAAELLPGECSVLENIYGHTFDLRCDRKFETADRLENDVSEFMKGEDQKHKKSVLHFLLCLADTGGAQHKPVIGHDSAVLPIVYPQKDIQHVLPPGPTNYGEPTIQRVQDQHFMHFPSEVFEKPGVSLNTLDDHPQEGINHMVFQAKPGSGLDLGRFFRVQDPEKCQGGYKDPSSAMFGALLHSKSSCVDMKLDIPDISEDRPLEITVPKISFESMEDEGIGGSISCSSTPSCSGLEDDFRPSHTAKGEPMDIWEAAIKYKEKKLYIWEDIGKPQFGKAKPFATEAGKEAFDKLYVAHMRNLQLLDPTIVLPDLRKINMKKLVKDVLYLIIGVPSDTFLFNENTQEFSIVHGTYISGLSPETVHTACTLPIECGTNYRRLCVFSEESLDPDSLHHLGLIFQAFKVGIQRMLQHYRGCILSIPDGKTLMQVNCIISKLAGQIRVVAEMCLCAVNPRKPVPQFQDGFPVGIKLLSYLYQESVDATNTEHYPLLLSLLNTSCGPYLRFVQEWVYHGVCQDVYGEFMIQTQEDFLRFRDTNFWTQGYILTAKDGDESVPFFLKDLAKDIFTCGKTVNLLRIISPHHFLLTMDKEIPRVIISFSEEQLERIEIQCQTYTSRMKQIARQHELSHRDKLAREEKAKEELLIRARHEAAEGLKRIIDEQIANKKAVDAKKRKQFSELKEQMESDLKRRATEIEMGKQEDRDQVDSVNRQELLEAKIEADLEEEARKEMIEYYSKLTAEAAIREQKALWRVRRRTRDAVRERFFIQQQEDLLRELENNPLPLADFAVDDDNLPTWAKENIPTAGPLPANLSDDKDLPNWAKEGINRTNPELGVDTDKDALPNWAQKGVEHNETVIVNDTDTVDAQGSDVKSKQHPSDATIDLKLQDENAIDRNRKTNTDLKTIEDIKLYTESVKKLTGGDLVLDTKPKEVNHPSYSSVGNWLFQDASTTNDKSGDGASTSKIGEHRDSGVDIHINQDSNVKSKNDHDVRTEIRDIAKSVPDSIYITAKDSVSCVDNEVSAIMSKSEDRVEVSDKSKVSGVTKPYTLGQKPPSPFKGVVPKTHAKVHIKLVGDMHATKESGVEAEIKPSVKVVSDRLYQESEPQEFRPQIKSLPGKHATAESEPSEENKPHIKHIRDVNEQSEEQEQKAHLKQVGDQHSSKESQQTQEFVDRNRIKRQTDVHANKQSEPEVLAPKKASAHGHVSEMSSTEISFVPKLRRHAELYANKESSLHDFGIKPVRRRVKGHSVGQESKGQSPLKPKIKIDPSKHVSAESDFVDILEIQKAKFRQRNMHGHASHSTAQQIMYGERFGTFGAEKSLLEESMPVTGNLEFWSDTQLEPYQDNYDHLDNPPVVDLMANLPNILSSIDDYRMSTDEDVGAHRFLTLAALLKRSVTAPLEAQISLVNQSIVNLYMTELAMKDHFEMLRMFLLMQDGEFGQTLGDQLFDKLSTNPKPHEIFNPIFLNNVLNKALRSSLQGDKELCKYISFTLKYIPQMIRPNAANALDCLELTYKVEWPINLVISEDCLSMYGQVFGFMLQLKRTVWVLKEMWHKLKRDALLNNASSSAELRKLQLYRHEMQHLVKMMQGYIANQVLHVTWLEFMKNLRDKVHSLDDLRDVHVTFIKTCRFRCLLNKKSERVMKIIQNIFDLILKFRTQLFSYSWSKDKETGEMNHPAFSNMVTTYNSFNEFSRFLFKVVNKLAMRGYQPHLQELLLRLNFNSHYQT